MTGVVSMDNVTPGNAEIAAGTLAHYHWREGYCVRDRANKIRFCISHDGREWERDATFHPIADVRDVVRYIRNHYERIRRQYQV